jgi:hypothetical protein
MDFPSSDGENSKKKEICDQRSCEEIHRKPKTHKGTGFAILGAGRVLRNVNDSRGTDCFQKTSPECSRNVYRYVERKEHIDICQVVSQLRLSYDRLVGLLVRTKTIRVTMDRQSLILLVSRSGTSPSDAVARERSDSIILAFAGHREDVL